MSDKITTEVSVRRRFVLVILVVYGFLCTLANLNLVSKAYGNPAPVAGQAATDAATNATAAAEVESHSTPATTRHAYAFLVGACDPTSPVCRNYMYDIMIAARILRNQGSKADVVVLLQIEDNNVTTGTLLPQTAAWLDKLGIQTHYIPPSTTPSFYKACMDKFRILGLTQYSRVLFLDADVMPLANLDYLFELSEAGVIQENLIVASKAEPANAGFFLLAPTPGALKDVNAIIQAREQKTRETNAKPYFDPVVGWGHTIEAPDSHMRATGQTETTWDFYGGFCDQGLLYHYTKYHRQSVTMVIGQDLHHYNNGTTIVQKADDAFGNHSKPLARNLVPQCRFWSGGRNRCYPPYTDFVHFTTWKVKKPWTRGPPDDLSEETQHKSAYHVWFYQLQLLNQELNMGLDELLKNWTVPVNAQKLGHRPDPIQAMTAYTDLLAY